MLNESEKTQIKEAGSSCCQPNAAESSKSIPHEHNDLERIQETHDHVPPAMSKAILSMDNLGIIASILCLIHCMAMPFLIALLPFIGLQFLESHESHLLLGTVIIAFALFAIVPGYLKHKSRRILTGMIVGVGAVLVGSFFSHSFGLEAYEMPFLVGGNLTLVATHLLNMRRVKSCCDH